MKLRATFRVTEFTNRAGSLSYRVTGTAPDGRRIRENFQDQVGALARKTDLEFESANFVPASRLHQTRLNDAQIAECERAVAELGDRPLMDAVRFYLENYREPQVKIGLRDAVAELLAAKTGEKARTETIQNLRFRLNAFVNFEPDGKLVCDVLANDIDQFINRDAKIRGLRSRKNDYLALSNFFNWASGRKPSYCVASPMPKRKFNFDDADPAVMPIETVRRLMSVCAEYKDGKTVPYFALALFAGIRPNELARLTWKQIDLDAGLITIGAGIAKTRSKRHVEFCQVGDQEPNLAEWLLPHVARRTPIAISRFDFEKVKALSGIRGWTKDILRHTAASHHLALFEHEGKTALWLGNSPAIIQRHYKGLVKRQDTAQFWSIRPEDAAGKIVKLAVG